MDTLFTIDCGEIYLQEFRVEDADAIFELTSQPEVYTFLPDWKSTLEQRVDWVANYEIPSNQAFLAAVPEISDQGYLKLGIILKETDELIGFCNTGPKDDLPEPNQEIVFAISKHFRNRGYTTKATKGLIRYLFENTNVETLNALALVENVGSSKVIQKSGFRFKGHLTIDNEEYYHYILVKQERDNKIR